jgi:hypothetical protein
VARALIRPVNITDTVLGHSQATTHTDDGGNSVLRRKRVRKATRQRIGSVIMVLQLMDRICSTRGVVVNGCTGLVGSPNVPWGYQEGVGDKYIA